jgi:hypothetical protein
MQKITQALKSRTVILAILQAVAGVLILILTEADMVATAVMVKSLVDIALRSVTTVPLSQK